MAVKYFLAWTLMLAALPGATTKCNSCNVHLGLINDTLGFLAPNLCCDEVDYPFTFLAHFTTNEHIITFYLHEYYLLDTEVRLCQSDFYDMYDDYYYPADDYAIERFCVDDYPFRCLPEKPLTAPELSFRSWNDDGFLNITIPFKPRPVLQTHGPYYKRPIFNITFERRRMGEPGRIADGVTIANLDMCSYNGYPVLTYDANRKRYVFECQCVDSANGSNCQWGGGCQADNLFSPCSGYGECRYYRGSIKCICDENHFGHRCEHHVSSGQPLQPSACSAMELDCSHLCTLARQPHCLCPPHLVLHNKTHCSPRTQLVDVTVQLLNNHHHHFSVDQAKKLLKEACITVMNASYQNDSKEFHFKMNKYQRNCLPEKSRWEALLNSSVDLSPPEQDFLWVGPLNQSVEEGNLVLQVTVYTSRLSVNVSFFAGQHQIYSCEVDSCEGYFQDEVITIILEEEKDTTRTIDTTCSYNNICTKDTICSITFLADRYDPQLDWGEFSVEVRHGNTSTRQSVVVDTDPRLLAVVKPLSASVDKNGNTTLTCTLIGDWKWDEDCEIKWVFPLDSGIFQVEMPTWNVSYLYIKHLKRSITVTCEVSSWRFCDDRRYRTKSMCVGRGCKPQVVAIHCLEPETLFCPTQKDGSIVWHFTPVNYMSYSTCPEGFEGISKRQCELSQNETAVWAEPDYYLCVYRPFNNLLQRPVMRYLKRGYHISVDCNSTVEEMRQLFEARTSMLLPREHSFIHDQLKYLLRPNIPPVDPLVFLGLFQEIRKKTAVSDTWQLLPLVRTYLTLETSQRGHSKLDDMLLWVQDIPTKWEYLEGEHNKRLRLEVTVPQGDQEALHVGAFVFLDPKSIPAGLVYSTESSKKQVVDHELSGPAVEVMVPKSNDLSFNSENITLNMSYYDPDVTTDRNVCGGAKVSGTVDEIVEWDLTRCTVLRQGQRGRRAMRCRCQGSGLFAFIKMPELVPTDTD